jgi:thiol-disulfide isomerase/thioredoxin
MVRGFLLSLAALVLCTVGPVAMAGPDEGAAPAIPGIAGSVVSPDGTPVAGAQVCLIEEHTNVDLVDGRLTRPHSDAEFPVVISDEHGRFVIDQVPDIYVIVAVAGEVGYGEALASREQPATEVKLQPWGRIEGKVTILGKPAVDLALNLDQASLYIGHFGERNKAKTDAEGRFVLERVKPGTVQASRGVEQFSFYAWPEPAFTAMNSSLGGISVEAGKTTHVEFDATVFEVRGKAVLPPGVDAPGIRVMAVLRDLDALPDPDRPLELLMDESPQHEQKVQQWRLSDAGRKHYQAMAAKWATDKAAIGCARDDGSFVARGMQAGRYSVVVVANSATGERTYAMTPDPPQVTVSAEQPVVELGDTKLVAVGNLTVGQTVPDLVCGLLVGQGEVRLADYRGKHLLLAGWGIDCGPCLVSMPKLAELHARLEKDERFALVSLYVNYDGADRGRKFVQDHGYNWTQAQISSEQITALVGPRGVPDYILIDPAGVVLSRGSDLSEAIRLLDVALAK